jgi:hypothetical protein
MNKALARPEAGGAPHIRLKKLDFISEIEFVLARSFG